PGLFHLAAQRPRRRWDAVEPGAIVPQDLAVLFAGELEPEELLDRLWESAVGMRVVARHDEIVRADLVYGLDRGFLVDIESDVALPLEIFARRHRQLPLAARAEFLPLVVEPPQPPMQPTSRSFEKSRTNLWVTFK